MGFFKVELKEGFIYDDDVFDLFRDGIKLMTSDNKKFYTVGFSIFLSYREFFKFLNVDIQFEKTEGYVEIFYIGKDNSFNGIYLATPYDDIECQKIYDNIENRR